MSPLLVQEVDDGADLTGKIELTEVEQTLRRLLLDVAQYIDNAPTTPDPQSQVLLPGQLAAEKLILRFTGGWVRDKLLGVPSHDIDVAINKMTGYQFGLKLKEYLEIPGNPEKYGLEGVASTDKQSQKAGTTDRSKTVGGLHKIEANPEKSKHLETVTTKILGLDIDLVNLRKETYTEESRNPQMEFGTPEEDALRRDATVNAMFYNINSEQIEDFTGRGYEDLQKSMLRTPLEPYQTFRDDPLRVLRLIRFASRLSYEIDRKALEAMRNLDIKDALRRKISRERVGVEIEKALRGPNPQQALRLVFELGLYETIFTDPTVDAKDQFQPDIENWSAILSATARFQDDPIAEVLLRDPEECFMAWQLAALVPYRHAPQPEPSEPGRKAPLPISTAVAKEGIKSTNKVCDIVTAAVRHQAEISDLVDRLHQQKRRPDNRTNGADASARDVLGMAVRRWGFAWRSQVAYAMLVEVADGLSAAENIERKYTAFVDQLRLLDLLEACSFKPLMDGKALAKALGTPPGPWMKEALDVVMAYQLRSPDTANAEDAIAEVKDQQKGGELTFSLVRHFLKLTIRPLFVKAKPSSVTETGRKNTTTVLPKKATMENMDDTVNKAWKGDKDAHVLHLLRWCIASLNERTVEDVWPLIVPPLLTLVDDWEVKYKEEGAKLIRRLLQVTPPDLLAKTGLGQVFEEALLPCITYLPTITEPAECVSLLNEAYPALLVLARVKFAVPPQQSTTTKHTSHQTLSSPRTKFLDTLLRKGVIYGYTHCSNYPLIVSVLFAHLTSILNELGIESIKHLKFVLPMLIETLSQRLLATTDKTISTPRSATKALQAVVLNCWPRMELYRGEVLKGAALCWLNFEDGTGNEVEELREELRETVSMLEAAVSTSEDVNFRDDCRVLVQAEPRLEGLLSVGDSRG